MSTRRPTRPRTAHELLQEQVTDLLTATGWRWLHVRRTIGKRNRWVTSTNVVGWPDLCPVWSLRQPGRHLAIEIKVPPDDLSPEQLDVSTGLVVAGFEFYVVTPRDVPDLAKVLARPSHKPLG